CTTADKGLHRNAAQYSGGSQAVPALLCRGTRRDHGEHWRPRASPERLYCRRDVCWIAFSFARPIGGGVELRPLQYPSLSLRSPTAGDRNCYSSAHHAVHRNSKELGDPEHDRRRRSDFSNSDDRDRKLSRVRGSDCRYSYVPHRRARDRRSDVMVTKSYGQAMTSASTIRATSDQD